MKVTLCLLVAFCATYASTMDIIDPVRILQEMVNIQKRNTERVIDDLTRYEIQIKNNIEIKFNKIKSTAIVNIKDIIDETLQDIESTVSTATAASGDVNNCFANAKMTLNALQDNGNNELEVCIQNANTYLEATLENVKSNIEVGGKIVTDLDAIIPNCYSSIYLKMQSCVFRKTLAMRSAVKRLEANAKSVKKTTNSVFLNALSNLRICTVKPVSNVRIQTTGIKLEFNACIRA